MIEPSQYAAPPAPRSSRTGGPIGLVAVILAGLAWAFTVARSVGLYLFPLLAPDFSGSFELYGLFAFVSAIVILVTALAALVCGTIGLVRVRPRRSLTVIATTIAALIVFDTVFFGVLGLSTGFLAGRF
ncbi:hypothetical protein AB0I45_08475 [Brevibacterium sp. NPDC049920]|uniref:Uncharacterized protein n=1 Tax=Brevibacterium pityocampae TaxID=506594 RepID=A0ABP8JHQ3_9MICO|nr:hypothetical protein [uncultured Brevibacterium sp.]